MSTNPPVYDLFNSVEAMLAPEALSNAMGARVTRVVQIPAESNNGLSGSTIQWIETDQRRLVLKRMSTQVDWVMFRTNDTKARAITLWQYGLLDRLLPQTPHCVLAAAHDGDGWAVLMEDLSGGFYDLNNSSDPGFVESSLNTLAHVHATFWQDTALQNPSLGLCSLADWLNGVKPSTAAAHPEWSWHFLHQAATRGRDVWRTLVSSQVWDAYLKLTEEPRPLFDAIGQFPATLVHGDPQVLNFFRLPNGTMGLIDWQLAGNSLMTFDLLYFVGSWEFNGPANVDSMTSHYRIRLEGELGQRFADDDWQRMLMLANCFLSMRMEHLIALLWERSDSAERARLEKGFHERGELLLWFLTEYP